MIWIVISIIGFFTTFGSLIYTLIQKKKYNSPFLNKYPIGHPMSPIPDMKIVYKHAKKIYKPGVMEIAGIDLNTDAQLSLLSELNQYREDMPIWKKKSNDLRFRFNNYFFTGHDAILLHSLLRHFKPKKIIEIGSGFSSAMMLDTLEVFPEIGTQLTFIEPFPKRLKTLMKADDKNRCIVIENFLQDIDKSFFTKLDRNDIIFVDTSHQMKVGSEVLYLFFEIMPILKPDVMIHFHDIFWPFEYPKEWVEMGRSWNESYGLHAFLEFNDSFEILYFNSYMGNVHKREVNESKLFCDLKISDEDGPGGNFDAGGSLWLRKIK